MANLSKKSKRYRSKETICKDVAFILNTDLSYGTKFAVLADITWVWSEFYGKYKGCKYWSKEAKSEDFSNRELRHEHLVPKKVLIDTLMSMEAPSSTEIFEYLDQYCIGVVVTIDEDKRLSYEGLRSKMPDYWDGKDPWARYYKVGIEVIKDDD